MSRGQLINLTAGNPDPCNLNHTPRLLLKIKIPGYYPKTRGS